MSEFVPTTDTVKLAYMAGADPYWLNKNTPGETYRTQEMMGEEFDRWLREHDRHIAEWAWNEGQTYEASEDILGWNGDPDANPYRRVNRDD